MTYEFPTTFRIADFSVIFPRSPSVDIAALVLFEVEITEPEVDEDAPRGYKPKGTATPYVTGFRVKLNGEWEDVDDEELLYAFLEAAFVYDEEAMIEVYLEENQ